MTSTLNDNKHYSGRQVFLYVLLAIVLTGLLTWFLAYRFLFPPAFRPTELSAREQQVLDEKLERLEGFAATFADDTTSPTSTNANASSTSSVDPLQPESYTENAANRRLNFSERELNALIASSPDMAQQLAIALDDNLASAKLLVPLPPDFPLFGGKTLRVNAGLELAFANGQPVVALQGVSGWGVPLPNAWLGGLKQVDLVQQFGRGEGFWNTFAEGVESIAVTEGELRIMRKE